MCPPPHPQRADLPLVPSPVSNAITVNAYALNIKNLSVMPAMDPGKLKDAIEKSER